jgi:hypothetical protein
MVVKLFLPEMQNDLTKNMNKEEMEIVYKSMIEFIELRIDFRMKFRIYGISPK